MYICQTGALWYPVYPLLDTLCVCLCVDVDCMYYAVDQGERGAINKTGLQCAHWQNNLCDWKKRGKTKWRDHKRQRECKIRWLGESGRGGLSNGQHFHSKSSLYSPLITPVPFSHIKDTFIEEVFALLSCSLIDGAGISLLLIVIGRWWSWRVRWSMCPSRAPWYFWDRLVLINWRSWWEEDFICLIFPSTMLHGMLFWWGSRPGPRMDWRREWTNWR